MCILCSLWEAGLSLNIPGRQVGILQLTCKNGSDFTLTRTACVLSHRYGCYSYTSSSYCLASCRQDSHSAHPAHTMYTVCSSNGIQRWLQMVLKSLSLRASCTRRRVLHPLYSVHLCFLWSAPEELANSSEVSYSRESTCCSSSGISSPTPLLVLYLSLAQ